MTLPQVPVIPFSSFFQIQGPTELASCLTGSHIFLKDLSRINGHMRGHDTTSITFMRLFYNACYYSHAYISQTQFPKFSELSMWLLISNQLETLTDVYEIEQANDSLQMPFNEYLSWLMNADETNLTQSESDLKRDILKLVKNGAIVVDGEFNFEGFRKANSEAVTQIASRVVELRSIHLAREFEMLYLRDDERRLLNDLPNDFEQYLSGRSGELWAELTKKLYTGYIYYTTKGYIQGRVCVKNLDECDPVNIFFLKKIYEMYKSGTFCEISSDASIFDPSFVYRTGYVELYSRFKQLLLNYISYHFGSFIGTIEGDRQEISRAIYRVMCACYKRGSLSVSTGFPSVDVVIKKISHILSDENLKPNELYIKRFLQEKILIITSDNVGKDIVLLSQILFNYETFTYFDFNDQRLKSYDEVEIFKFAITINRMCEIFPDKKTKIKRLLSTNNPVANCIYRNMNFFAGNLTLFKKVMKTYLEDGCWLFDENEKKINKIDTLLEKLQNKAWCDTKFVWFLKIIIPTIFCATPLILLWKINLITKIISITVPIISFSFGTFFSAFIIGSLIYYKAGDKKPMPETKIDQATQPSLESSEPKDKIQPSLESPEPKDRIASGTRD
jgi:hypothetical protein